MASNDKGKEFERKISKELSKRFISETGVDNAFMRNHSGSGAFFGGKNSHRANGVSDKDLNTGDIVTPLNFKYTVECKHYKTAPSIKGIMDGKVAQWDGWIGQSMDDSKTSGKEAIVIMKYNLVSEMLMVSANNKDFSNNHTPIMVFKSKDHGIWNIYNFNQVLKESNNSAWFNVN